MVSAARLDDAGFERAFSELRARALAEMKAEDHPVDRVDLKRVAELRYAGQAYELAVVVQPQDVLADVLERFHTEHARTYGHRSDGDPVDIVSIRVFARVLPRDAAMSYARLAAKTAGAAAAQPETRRNAYFGKAHGIIDTPVIARAALGRDWRRGPLIVEEYDSTCVIPPLARARLDAVGNIEIDVQSPEVAS
jgi:N-methylhydantoinase A